MSKVKLKPLRRKASSAPDQAATGMRQALATFGVGSAVELLSAGFESLSEGVAAFEDMRLVFCNAVWAEIMSLPPELRRPGTPLMAMIRWRASLGDYGPGDADALALEHYARLKVWSRTLHPMEARFPNGDVYEIKANRFGPKGFIWSYVDVRDRVEAEAALRASDEAMQERIRELEIAREELAEERRRLAEVNAALDAKANEAASATRAKSAFLAAMSHELRTPLNAVIGFSEIIADEMLGPVNVKAYAEYGRDIRTSGQHLLDIISDILDLSKVEAGRMELHDDEVDVTRAAEACVRLVRGRANKGKVALKLELAPGLALVADEIKLKQIMLNLLSNAVKFTPAGGTVTIASSRRETGEVAVEVSDTGIGMSEREVEVALQPFGQVDPGSKRRNQGTGLGLPLAKSLAELHGAAVAIESAPGVGTKIQVTFPASRTLAD